MGSFTPPVLATATFVLIACEISYGTLTPALFGKGRPAFSAFGPTLLPRARSGASARRCPKLSGDPELLRCCGLACAAAHVRCSARAGRKVGGAQCGTRSATAGRRWRESPQRR